MINTEAGVTKMNVNPGVVFSNKRVTLRSLQIENELLKAQATVNNIAMGEMSKEICDLNTQLQNLLDQIKDMT